MDLATGSDNLRCVRDLQAYTAAKVVFWPNCPSSPRAESRVQYVDEGLNCDKRRGKRLRKYTEMLSEKQRLTTEHLASALCCIHALRAKFSFIVRAHAHFV